MGSDTDAMDFRLIPSDPPPLKLFVHTLFSPGTASAWTDQFHLDAGAHADELARDTYGRCDLCGDYAFKLATK